jgi:hypothetical protein
MFSLADSAGDLGRAFGRRKHIQDKHPVLRHERSKAAHIAVA